MERTKCPHCGSIYVDFKGLEQTHEGETWKYYCQGCKKSFTIDKQRLKNPEGKKIATFHCYGDNKIYTELYKTEDGRFSTLSKHYEKFKVKKKAPKFVIDMFTTQYNLKIDTYSFPNDSDGIKFEIAKIELAKEYISEALKNDAMRAAYNESEKIFDISFNGNLQMLRDIEKWLCSFIGARVPETPVEKVQKLFGGLFGKK